MLLFAPSAAVRSANLALLEQGRYLAAVGDCVSCHTRPNGQPFAGGVRLTTPFGVIYSANITPDIATGIGAWSEAQFARALREGVAADGTQLYPAFPYTAYSKVTDADSAAIYAYLRSLKPVAYAPPKNALRFPFSVRGLLAGWKLLFFEPGRFVPDRSRSAQWNRGAYLTQGLGHCGGCHTPRNGLGAERSAAALAGGSYLDEIIDEVVDDKLVALDEPTVRRWSAPDLTPAASGLGAWSREDITAYLRSGHGARAGAFGPMGGVVANSTRHLTDADLQAIAEYLRTLPPSVAAAAAPRRRDTLAAGEAVYNARCGDCHLQNGQGVPRGGDGKPAPPLAGSAVAQAPDPATLINVVLYGAHEAGQSASAWPRMSGFELSVGLSDEQIAALCTYVRSSWGHQAAAVDAAAVRAQR